MFGMQAKGPLVYWRPWNGERHALWPTSIPRAGQERDTLCGAKASITEPTEIEWLAPTCGVCMSKAQGLRDSRA